MNPASSEHIPTSAILERVAANAGGDYTIDCLREDLGSAALGLGLLIFALPNIVPFPMPGVSAITALPMLFFSLQMAAMRRTLWLPNFIARTQLGGERFVRMITYIIPWVRRFERLCKPRLHRLASPTSCALSGLIISILALMIALPIPFGNLVPALAVCVLCLAVIEHDGVCMLIGWIMTLLACIYLYGLLSLYFWAVITTVEMATGVDLSSNLR